MNWRELKFFETGEWDVIKEHLDDLKAKRIAICPQRANLFRAFKECPYEQTKVIICGQDPYPNPAHATGLAFDIPADIPRAKWPPTLVNLLTEYQNDLHYPEPTTGSLVDWCKRGVLLWNTTPSCTAWRSLSHADWTEYTYLNRDILGALSEKGNVIFVFLGNRARELTKYVSDDRATILCASHPSPRGSLNSRTPFLGSRIFSKINGTLRDRGLAPIDWRLT
jgi:uracil-DNA glycosylase